jgi:hypothetical protein
VAVKIVKFLVAYTAAFLAFMTLLFLFDKSWTPAGRAILGMGLSLNLVWCLVGGLLMLRFRRPIEAWWREIPGKWQVKFVLGCTLLALLEEVVTVTITNLAPLYGVKVGEAAITASANYIDVVTMHSVVVFVPMFVCWALMLTRWSFTPTQVFLLFGAAGAIAEAQFSNDLGHLVAGFWFFVYGLMVWLPACAVPTDRPVRKPQWWAFPLAVVLPGFFAIPLVIPIKLSHHPKMHFPAPDALRAEPTRPQRPQPTP